MELKDSLLSVGAGVLDLYYDPLDLCVLGLKSPIHAGQVLHLFSYFFPLSRNILRL